MKKAHSLESLPRKPLARLIPLLARVAVTPTAAIASTLFATPTFAAQGDLDPAFADVGRLGPLSGIEGDAWAIESDGSAISIAGGDHCAGFYCYYYDDVGFLGHLSDTGTLESMSGEALIRTTQVLDIALQPDGKAVAVGNHTSRFQARPRVFRLNGDGHLDPTFGTGGIAELDASSGRAMAVLLEPDGRIVVAGSRDGRLFVLRLLANGTSDASFGTQGLFEGPFGDFFGARARLARTSAGGYRISANVSDGNGVAQCIVVALTANGALDSSFGTSGVASLDNSGAPMVCTSMAARSDDRLLVAGSEGSHGFLVRLLGTGAEDAGFSGAAVADSLTSATALDIDASGAIVVAGSGPQGVSGAVVMRLQANGELDNLFGDHGTTWIDLPSDRDVFPVINDLEALPDRSVLAAGGAGSQRRPFAARLLGANGGNAPGVIGVERSAFESREADGQVVVTVRRMGGGSGNVSVGYETVPSGSIPATGGEDYTEVAGRLTWSDGDRSDRQIVVPIVSDAAPEDQEHFMVALDDVQGGAGLGTRNATIELRADGEPAGQFSIESGQSFVNETQRTARVVVSRNYYSSGPVSVTVTPLGGTATAGEDYVANPVTVSWGDGESGPITVVYEIHDDSIQEPSEGFTVALSDPTGGAIIGPRASVAIVINASDASTGSGSSGGGALGFLSLLFLGASALLKAAFSHQWRSLQTGAGASHRPARVGHFLS